MQWRGLPRRPAPRARALRRGDRRLADGVRPRPGRVGRRPALQLRGGRASRTHRSAWCRRRSSRPTTCSTRAARSRAAAPGLALDADGVPLGDYLFAFDFGDVAVEVCEDAWSPDGPMRRRCYSGAEIVVNVSASPYRMGIDSTRREMLATRAADNQAVLLYANAVGGQDGLIYDGGGFVFQNGRLVARSAALRGGLVVGGRRSRSHAAPAHGEHDLAQRLRGVPPAARDGADGHESTGATADRSALDLSGAGRRQLLPAGQPRPGARPARPRARRSVRGARHRREELLREDRRVHVARHRAVGRPRLDADAAGGLARGAAHQGRRRDLGVLHAEPALAGRHAGTRRTMLADELGVTLQTIPIDEATDREVEATREMLGGAAADRDDAPERPGARCAASGCGTGPTRRARCSCRPAT